jgi:glycosyltransferase involved in cell wall biosynthesis
MAKISVIICCYNSEKVIRKPLEALKSQIDFREDWEIILVDNNCTDNTVQIAEEIWASEQTIPLRIVKESQSGLIHARLKGVAEARYPIISFIDDDNIPPPDWIKFHSKKMEDSSIGILGCTAVAQTEGTFPAWFKDNENAFATGKLYTEMFADITERGVVYGAGMVVRKQIFTDLEARKWKPLLSGRIGNIQAGGEDAELVLAAKQLGYRIFYTNEISLNHYILPERLTWERLNAMTFGFGAADVYLLLYDLVYAESIGKRSINKFLRKNWLYNIIGKKTSLIVKIWRISDPKKRQLFKTRNDAFCKTLMENKENFKQKYLLIKDRLV